MPTTEPIPSTIRAKFSRVGVAKVGIVGLGARAKVLTGAAVSGKLKIIAAYSRSEQKRRSFQLETRVPVVSDLKTLLSYPMLDGVIVTVPADQRLALAIEIAKAKKHIYIENPIAGTLEQGLEIAALEQKYGITLTVGYGARFLPGVRRIREAMDAGELGTVALIETNFSAPRALALTSADWRFHPEKAPGGPLSELSIQQFDVLRYLGGEIIEITAMGASLSPAQAEVDDQSTALVKFADGKLGYVGSSWTSPEIFSVRALGSKAVIDYEIAGDSSTGVGNPGEAATLSMQRASQGPALREMLALPETNIFRAQLELFAEACRTGKSTELTATNANAALAVVAAALKSIRNSNKSIVVSDVLRLAQSRLSSPL